MTTTLRKTVALAVLTVTSVLAPRASHAQSTTLTIGSAADAFPAGPFGQAPAPGAAVAIGQTFVRPTDAVCALSCYLEQFSFWLGTSQDLAVNPSDLRFQAYIAEWDGTKATNVLYTSGVQIGPVAASQQFTFAPLNVDMQLGTQYVAFLSVVGLAAEMPGIATSDFDLVFGDPAPYSGGAWVYTDNGSTLTDLTTTPWSYQGDSPQLQARFEATFTANTGATTVPEPSTLLLFTTGGVALLLLMRKRKV